jgi:hypothetical protein
VNKEQKLLTEHEKDLAALFVRTEPLGYDRNNVAYYSFEGDRRLWVQILEPGIEFREAEAHPGISSLLRIRPSTRKFSWKIYTTMPEIWRVIGALDERGVREKELKGKLCATFGLSGKSADGATYQTTGSDYIGGKVRRTFGKVI